MWKLVSLSPSLCPIIGLFWVLCLVALFMEASLSTIRPPIKGDSVGKDVKTHSTHTASSVPPSLSEAKTPVPPKPLVSVPLTKTTKSRLMPWKSWTPFAPKTIHTEKTIEGMKVQVETTITPVEERRGSRIKGGDPGTTLFPRTRTPRTHPQKGRG